MKKSLTLAALMACAACAHAAPINVPFVVKCNGAVTSSVTASVQGYIRDIVVSSPTTNGVAIGTVTGDVRIVASPAVGTGHSDTLIYTNAAVTSATSARPRFVPTGTTGSALSSLTVAEPYLCAGDSVTLRVIQDGAATNVLWRVDIKVDR